jgi:hypothetical protein
MRSLEMRIVIVATPSNAHTTKTLRPAGVTGAKSPNPIVVNAVTPEQHILMLVEDVKNDNHAQKYIAIP